jgi:hypothetical protein
MASLTHIEMQKLEALLGMASGYVLNFSTQNFERFVNGTIRVNINSPKYEVYGTSKAKRLRALWEIEDNKTVGKVIEELIKYYKTQIELGKTDVKKVDANLEQECITIANRLQGKQKMEPGQEDTFLQRQVDETALDLLQLPTSVMEVIEQRVVEIKKCLKADAPLSVIFLSGSVLEGILLNVATLYPSKFNQSNSSPKDKSGKVKSFPEWSLNSFIEVSYELGYIGLDVKKHSHSLRDFRNYIHPFAQMSSGFKPDSHTADISWKVLKAAMHDIYQKLK